MDTSTILIVVGVVVIVGSLCLCTIVGGWVNKQKKKLQLEEKKREREKQNEEMQQRIEQKKLLE